MLQMHVDNKTDAFWNGGGLTGDQSSTVQTHLKFIKRL